MMLLLLDFLLFFIHKNEKLKVIKDNCRLEMFMYLFDVFNEVKDSYHITTVM